MNLHPHFWEYVVDGVTYKACEESGMAQLIQIIPGADNKTVFEGPLNKYHAYVLRLMKAAKEFTVRRLVARTQSADPTAPVAPAAGATESDTADTYMVVLHTPDGSPPAEVRKALTGHGFYWNRLDKQYPINAWLKQRVAKANLEAHRTLVASLQRQGKKTIEFTYQPSHPE